MGQPLSSPNWRATMDKKTCYSCDGDGRYIFNGLLPFTHDAETGNPLHSEELEGREIQCSDCGGTGIAKVKPTLHTMKPLEWKKGRKENHNIKEEAWVSVLDGEYSIFPNMYGVRRLYFQALGNFCHQHWDGISLEKAKEIAQEHYESQLLKCLEVYRG